MHTFNRVFFLLAVVLATHVAVASTAPQNATQETDGFHENKTAIVRLMQKAPNTRCTGGPKSGSRSFGTSVIIHGLTVCWSMFGFAFAVIIVVKLLSAGLDFALHANVIFWEKVVGFLARRMGFADPDTPPGPGKTTACGKSSARSAGDESQSEDHVPIEPTWRKLKTLVNCIIPDEILFLMLIGFGILVLLCEISHQYGIYGNNQREENLDAWAYSVCCQGPHTNMRVCEDLAMKDWEDRMLYHGLNGVSYAWQFFWLRFVVELCVGAADKILCTFAAIVFVPRDIGKWILDFLFSKSQSRGRGGGRVGGGGRMGRGKSPGPKPPTCVQMKGWLAEAEARGAPVGFFKSKNRDQLLELCKIHCPEKLASP